VNKHNAHDDTWYRDHVARNLLGTVEADEPTPESHAMWLARKPHLDRFVAGLAPHEREYVALRAATFEVTE
jgi:hypothetical protein